MLSVSSRKYIFIIILLPDAGLDVHATELHSGEAGGHLAVKPSPSAVADLAELATPQLPGCVTP